MALCHVVFTPALRESLSKLLSSKVQNDRASQDQGKANETVQGMKCEKKSVIKKENNYYISKSIVFENMDFGKLKSR